MTNLDVPARGQGLFTTDDGKNVVFTFVLVSSLFLLWGFCNGMIDVMDKHFQTELGLTQVAVRLGAVRALPGLLPDGDAGRLAGQPARLQGRHHRRTADGGGGRVLVHPGDAHQRDGAGGRRLADHRVLGYLAGVCVIAAGLTFLETVANPYTTVLGPTRYAATRINLAQSCNGVGWIFGPIIGGMFFYSKDAAGRSTGSETL